MDARVGRRALAALPIALLGSLLAVAPAAGQPAQTQPPADGYLFHDSHFHLTNYVQQGTDIHKYLEIMGDKVGRSTLFGIPLQQTWSYENSGDYAPTYYLQSDAPLYYYSFTDAFIANAYKSLTPEQQQRFDPMITGFNPADMYAADHIRRVLETYPGVFTGIGEFTIHKEFVSSKVAGDTASLTDPALDRVLDFAGEVGLVVILHSDIDMPFAKTGAGARIPDADEGPAAPTSQDDDHLGAHGSGSRRPPGAGQATAGTTERPPGHLGIVEAIINDPQMSHVYFDISWDEVAKYAVSTPEIVKLAASQFNRYPDRFLFGTDNVAPSDQATQLKVFNMWDPVWALLTPEASLQIRKGNYERLFDAARAKVRAWEKANIKVTKN